MGGRAIPDISAAKANSFPSAPGKDTVIFPGFDGGAEWGGPAVDPETGILYVNANDLSPGRAGANTTNRSSRRAALYLSHCAICHGDDMAGAPPQFPSLIDVGKRLERRSRLSTVIQQGRGRMPAFPNLRTIRCQRWSTFSRSGDKQRAGRARNPRPDMRYRFTGYKRFLRS